MFGGLVALFVAQSFDLVALVGAAIGRAASVGFLSLATLSLAQALDVATFSVMVSRHGTSAEANPIVSDLFVSLGMPAVVAVKVALVLLVGGLYIAAASRGRRGAWSIAGGLPLALAITAGLIGGITNAAAILG